MRTLQVVGAFVIAAVALGAARAQNIAAEEPATSVPAVAMSSVMVAYQVPGFPCFGGAPRCGDTVANTLGMLWPLAYVAQGAPVMYVLTFQDNTSTGPCTIAYSLTQGSTVIQSGAFDVTCAPGYNLYYFPNTIPFTPGKTKLIGTFTAGTIKSEAGLAFYIE